MTTQDTMQRLPFCCLIVLLSQGACTEQATDLKTKDAGVETAATNTPNEDPLTDPNDDPLTDPNEDPLSDPNEDPLEDTVDASPDSKVDAAPETITEDTEFTFVVDSKKRWNASGFHLEANHPYTILASIDDKWLDATVPADLDGWLNKNDPRISIFAPLRRIVDNNIGFYQFAACIDKRENHCFAVGEATPLSPSTSGEPFFFVNDVPGFENNNVGTATVTIIDQNPNP